MIWLMIEAMNLIFNRIELVAKKTMILEGMK